MPVPPSLVWHRHDRPGTFPRALDHVGYAVADLDRSIGFYEALLGVPLLMRKTWMSGYVGEIVGYPDVVAEGAFFRLPGGVVLELLEYKPPYASRGVDMESYNAGNAHSRLVTDDMEGLRAPACGRLRRLPLAGSSSSPGGRIAAVAPATCATRTGPDRADGGTAGWSGLERVGEAGDEGRIGSRRSRSGTGAEQ